MFLKKKMFYVLVFFRLICKNKLKYISYFFKRQMTSCFFKQKTNDFLNKKQMIMQENYGFSSPITYYIAKYLYSYFSFINNWFDSNKMTLFIIADFFVPYGLIHERLYLINLNFYIRIGKRKSSIFYIDKII